jgi:hypothetical protein
MADPKKPDPKAMTRPVPSVSDRTEPIATSERTEPITRSEFTQPTVSVTRPTVVYSKESTRPAPPATAPPTLRDPVTGVRRSSTRTPTVKSTGSVKRTDMMTDGMKARRREIERKKRRAALERMRMEEELSEGWRRVFKTSGFIILVLALGYGYWRVQQMYGDRWPLMAVWLMMAGVILTAFGWILWYMNKSDI